MIADENYLMRCGCHEISASFWDSGRDYRYEIVLCTSCGATWAYDYDERVGNIEAGDEEYKRWALTYGGACG